MATLSTLQYKNIFTETFKGDESGDLRPRQTPGVLYSRVKPTPVSGPRLLAWSEDMARLLGVDKPSHTKDLHLLSGNWVAPTMKPYAACYAGHQFGNWAGQLGDGRAITLGEIGTENGRWELQLKGAGPTPYSRRADGRAVLRSSVREFLMSEAMHYLGVPTTRALSLVATGDQVMRDMFYDGHPQMEPGAIVARVAPSFLRFGNFEMPAARRELDNLTKLVAWTIDSYYPHIGGAGEERVLNWFGEVVERTAKLMIEWFRVGFVHGVMNTDNMSILGLTIDYGPYSFLDDYDPNFTPNTTDLPGRRYAFAKQPSVGYWNLGCLANALVPLLSGTDEIVKVLEGYEGIIVNHYREMMSRKLGLDEVRPEDAALFAQFEQVLSLLQPDMTIFYQLLIDLPLESGNEDAAVQHFAQSFYAPLTREEHERLEGLLSSYSKRLQTNGCSREESVQKMRAASPRFVLRNYLLHQAIEGLQNGDDALFQKLQAALKEPYSNKGDEFFVKRPDWAGQKAGCSMLSCSS